MHARICFFETLPLYETVSLLTPHSSPTAPGTRRPTGPLPPPLKHILLGENIQQSEKTTQCSMSFPLGRGMTYQTAVWELELGRMIKLMLKI